MMHPRSPLAIALLALTLAACSSDGDGPSSASVPGDTPGGARDDAPPAPDAPADRTPPASGAGDEQPDPRPDPRPDPDPRVPSADGLPPPVVAEPTELTGPLLVPSTEDFFFTALEIDPEPAVPGGPPTTPKHLRIDLVSNDWAELNWAPSNDDGEVVEYRIDRDDGVSYSVRGDQQDPRAGTQRAIERYWRTTSFIDCNYTRFAYVIHECATDGPRPGDTFSYSVVAIDEQGNESPASNPVRVHYHEERGAPVSDITDPYLGENLALTRDVTHTAHFLDRFTLMFEDEFDAGAIDPRLWRTELVWGDETLINREQQYFVDTQEDAALAAAHDPFVFTDDTLIIEAVPTPAAIADALPDACDAPYENARERCAFLSGALSSHDRFHLTYGYVESRMKVSGAAGALSSFYIQSRFEGEGRGFHAPEIDIVEYLGENPFGDEDAFQNYHFGDTATFVESGGRERLTRRSPTMHHEKPEGDLYSDDFHTYGVLWEPQLIIWYIDGREIRRLSGPQVGRQAMNIVAYLVAGSGWAPEPDRGDPDLFPLRLEIDWIRAWQRDGYRTTGLYPVLD